MEQNFGFPQNNVIYQTLIKEEQNEEVTSLQR